MFKSFLYKILEKRHFWRYATFGEIADLYAAQTLRTAAIALVSGFSSVFMYKQGYSIEFIMGFWAVYFLLKVFLGPLSGMVVSYLGTTTSTMLSNILYIPAIIALSLVPELKFTALVLYCVFLSISVALHELCYLVVFSKVKSVEHAGKEIGFMNILEKIVIAASPVVGGLMALWFGVQATMWLSGIILALAGVPLFKLKNQSEKRHRFLLRGFPWRLALSGLIARCAIGFDIISSSIVWGLFLAIILLPTTGDAIYATLGALSSVTVIVTIVASSVFGKLIDNSKGGVLLRVGVVVNVMVHLSRTLLSTPVGAVGVNIANEAASTAQGMSFMRGMFDVADVSGFRVAYLVISDVFKNLGSAISCVVMALCAMFIGGRIGFNVFYMITAIVCATVFFVRFKIYR